MYERFYGLREKPFALTPDPDFLYLGRHHSRALLQLEYGLANDAAFVLITGEVGSGKTTLVRYLLKRFDAGSTVGLIANTARGTGRLLQWVCSAYGLDIAGKDDVALYNTFIDFVIEEYAEGRRVVLIVDEAQNLGRVRLEACTSCRAAVRKMLGLEAPATLSRCLTYWVVSAALSVPR